MNRKFFLFVALGMIVLSTTVFSQVATRAGSIFGKVVDDDGGPLPGVSITLESNATPAVMALSGLTGGFRFANLSPGRYNVTFSMEGFTELRTVVRAGLVPGLSAFAKIQNLAKFY